jgi:putative tricarboxylic transport membrane protein
MDRYDKITSSLWLCLGLYVTIKASFIGIGSMSNPGPGFIFLWGGMGLCFFSGVVFLSAYFEKSRGNGKAILWKEIRWKKIISLILSLLIFTYFFEKIGFIVSVLLLMVYLFKGIEYQRWSMAILSAVLTSLMAYIVFALFLGCQLPRGILPF